MAFKLSRMASFGRTVKLEPLVAIPLGVVTLIVPDVAPVGTVADIEVAEVTENEAEVPLKLTSVAPVNASPVIVMISPTNPLPGPKLDMVGGMVKNVALVAVPAAVVTVTEPVIAPLGTVAEIAVEVVTK